ncbi:hypothetical protein LSAT2_000616 [Lamellibrachia satsuma]|nr:hypothetical protein LSAT2_000616 [Lamellibrachia satsuma]
MDGGGLEWSRPRIREKERWLLTFSFLVDQPYHSLTPSDLITWWSANFLHFRFTREVCGGDEARTEDAKQVFVGVLNSLQTAFNEGFVDFASIEDKCPLAFGSWSHHSGELILRPQTTIVHTNEYKRNENGEWNVLGVKGHVYSRRFACCKEIFTYAIYFVVMKRRPLFYLFHLAFPISLFMVIGVFVFIVPPESGEKVDLAMSVLLSMSFFMLVLMDNIPPSSETISLFAYFIGGVTALLSVATYLSVMITFVYFQGVQGRRPPKWFKFIVLSCLAKLLGIGEYSFLTGLWRIVRVQNSATRLVARYSRLEHITPVMKKVHWLPVKQLIPYNILLLIFRAEHESHLPTSQTCSLPPTGTCATSASDDE